MALPAQAELNPMPTTIGSGTAVEGDTLSVNGGVVKLWGIDAPDMGQKCARAGGQEYDCYTASRDALTKLISGKQIECHIRSKDSNGQQVGTCGVGGYDLAALMIKGGWAMAYHSLNLQYDQLEGVAQARRVGLWAGEVDAPWDWRAKQLKKGKK